jgi:hypothetical protein
MRRKLALLAVIPAALMIPTAAYAVSAGNFSADLRPIPHQASADGGSNVTGSASLRLNGRSLIVDLHATGLTPNESHAMHIHGEVAAANECPSGAADTDGDGLVSLQEGAPFYGPIDVSFTETGDTSPASGLELARFPVASAAGVIDYHRTITVPKNIAKNLGSLHIVLHGTDLPTDEDASSQSSLFEATLPVACGEIDQSAGQPTHSHR